MTEYLYLDIETIPAQSNSARDFLAKAAKVDSRLKVQNAKAARWSQLQEAA